ncbi:type II secretion system minor pseudopilin GspJ [Motilimonas cestriensis]|uniref:Type II secretion system protein J n=1 Tax=Motilimonas cestriensis TaxID=2742685 RepID=A0ABS8W9I7_9GAMM|nr:type II secretion system minor pseudopilin GspJ [Motilimonas cestriensis]MCE2594762.1 type II secretion system minor pseudopilin GspJ [Motilimonas cestriensis]
MRLTQRGFTLLEILIAIAVFSVLSLAAYQVLQGVMRSDKISSEHTEKLKQMQRAMLIIERDMTQMVARTTRNGAEPNGALLRAGKYIAESESDGIDFVRLGWSNPQGQLPRSNLVRVAYRIKENNLERLYFLYPDAVSGQEPEVQVLIKGVNNLTLRYWDKSWQASWTNKDKLPAGIAMEFDFEDYGVISRLFLTPEGEAVKAKVPQNPARNSSSNNTNSASGANSTTGGNSTTTGGNSTTGTNGPNGGPVNGGRS